MKATFVQFLPEIVGENKILEYYKEVYERTPGYQGTINQGLMEIPTWIPVIAGMLPPTIEKELLLVKSMGQFVEYSWENPKDTYMFSVLDVNKHLVRSAIGFAPEESRFILGGYVDPAYFENQMLYENTHWLSSPEGLTKYFRDVDLDAPPDYSLFRGWKTIPRLTLSEGCLFDCHFCTIDRNLTLKSPINIQKQVKAIVNSGLEFELVYINDKTFGQADNWLSLHPVYEYIRIYNPKFQGFVVQTTANMPIKLYNGRPLLYEWWNIGVRYVEVGVETPDDNLLQRLNKPYRLGTLHKMTELFRTFQKMAFIPNIIFGIPGDTYAALETWLWENGDIIEFINPFILSDYFDGKGETVSVEDRVSTNVENDSNENTIERSWLTDEEQRHALEVLEKVLYFTGG